MADHEIARDPAQRQRRRKKRMSRELSEDHTNESLESPSSLPERIPLQEVLDREKVSVPHSASNNSGDQEGSSGIQPSSAEKKKPHKKTKEKIKARKW